MKRSETKPAKSAGTQGSKRGNGGAKIAGESRITQPAGKRADALARRRHLVIAALDLYRSDPSNTTLEAIAEQAGVGIATLYRNFPDRRSLEYACGEYIFAEMVELQEEIIERMEEDPAAAWSEYVRELTHMQLGAIISPFAPDNLDTLPDTLTTLRAEVAELGDRIITIAHEHGLVDPAYDHMSFIVGMITVTRPPVPGILALDPKIPGKLAAIFSAGLRQAPPTD